MKIFDRVYQFIFFFIDIKPTKLMKSCRKPLKSKRQDKYPNRISSLNPLFQYKLSSDIQCHILLLE